MQNLDSSSQNPVHSFAPEEEKTGISLQIFFVLIIGTIVVGILSGLLITKLIKTPSSTSSTNSLEKGKVVGLVDKNTFKDSAQGILKEGGIDGEGNFHLERPGGVSQNVYLTSGTVDMTQFIGKKVKVYGATFQGKKAGWLMDVGYVEVL